MNARQTRQESSRKTVSCAGHRLLATDWRLQRAARMLQGGGVIVHATEAVFGLAASAFDHDACARVRRLKRRAGKPFIVVAAALEQLVPLVSLATPLRSDVLASWPGPHTWVLTAMPGAPVWLRDAHGRIAVRVTAHAQMAALCLAAGPVISTSANPAGRAPARALWAARHYFQGDVDFYLAGSLGREKRPSTIRDGSTGTLLRV